MISDPTPDCALYADVLPLLGDPTATVAPAAREHLRGCRFCQARLAEYQHIDRALRDVVMRSAPPRRRTEEIMRSIQQRAATDHPPAPSRPAPAPSRWWRGFPGVAAVALVAAIAIFATLVFRSVGPGANLGPKQYTLRGTTGLFAGVSMVAANEGWALAQITKTPQGDQPLTDVTFYHYLNGAWTSVVVHTHTDFSTGGVSGFNGMISLDSPTDGWAVANNFNQVSVLLRFQNGAWAVAAGPQASYVQAVAPNAAWALGPRPQTNSQLIWRFDGARWSQETVSGVPDGAMLNVVALSMRSATAGDALAAIAQADGSGQYWAQLNDVNGAWSVGGTITTDNLIGLHSLAMTDSGDGWAVGERYGPDAGGNTLHAAPTPVVFHAQGGAWTRLSLPDAPGGYSQITGVTLTGAASGWIVGQTTDAYFGATTDNYTQHAALWQITGGTIQRATLPALGFAADALTGLAFAPDGTGFASGYVSDIPPGLTVQDTDILARASPLLLRYQNGAWTVVTLG